MKTSVNVFVIGMLIMLLSACESFSKNDVTTSAQLALSAKAADILIQEGIPVDTVLSVQLTRSEILTIDQSLNEYSAFRAKWKDTVNDPITLSLNLVLLHTDYARLNTAYIDVRNIVQLHWDEYPASIQFELQNYDKVATAIDKAATELLAKRRQIETINAALQYGALIAKVAVL